MTTYQSGYWTETDGGEVAKLLVVFVKSLQYNYLFGIVPSLMFGAIDDYPDAREADHAGWSGC